MEPYEIATEVSELTTDEIIGWLQIVQLLATMFLLPAIYFFRKAYRMFTNMKHVFSFMPPRRLKS